MITVNLTLSKHDKYTKQLENQSKTPKLLTYISQLEEQKHGVLTKILLPKVENDIKQQCHLFSGRWME